MHKIKGHDLPPVHILTGGSPCQDLSVAGQRAGLSGERSGLFMEQIRIAKELRDADKRRRNVSDDLANPRFFVWENVPGAFSSGEGEDFRIVLEEIVHIKDSSHHVPRPLEGQWRSAGAIVLDDEFSLAWRVLDAQFWGVPQRRRRIFLVADFGGNSAPQILFKQVSLQRNSKESKGARKGTAGEAASSTYDSGRAYLAPMNPKPQILCLNDQGGERMDVTEDFTATLRAGMNGHPPLVLGAKRIDEEDNEDSNSKSVPVLFENHGIDGRYTGPHPVSPCLSARMGTGGNNVPLTIDKAGSYCIAGNIVGRETKNGGNGLGCQEDIAYTLTATDRHSVFSMQRTDDSRTQVFGQSQFANYAEGVSTLRSSGGDHGGGSENLAVTGKNLIRRLTPLECERLQGFPDGWTDIGGASDSPRYKALGNSVAIPCVVFVLCGIAKVLRETEKERSFGCISTPTT